MEKTKLLLVLRTLSSMESLMMAMTSERHRVPDYLLDQLAEAVDFLEAEILKKELAK